MSEQNSKTEDDPRAKLNRESLRNALYIFSFLRPYRWYFFLGLLLLFLSSVVFLVFPYLAGLLVDIAQDNAEFEITLGKAAWILFGILILQGLISYFRIITFAIVSEKGLADIRRKLFSHLIALPIYFFESSKVGELISRVTADIEKLYNAFSVTLAELIRQIIILVVGIVFLSITAPRLAGIMLLTFPVIVIGAMIFGRYIRKLSKDRQTVMADTNHILSEVIQNIAVVKSFVNEFFESRRYSGKTDQMVEVSLKYARARALFSVFIITFLFGGLFFIIWQGAAMVNDGTMTAGGLVSFVSYTAIIGGAIAGLGNFYSQILGALGATERVRELMQESPETPIDPSTDADFTPLDLKPQLKFENVQFSYPSRTDIPVLSGIDFSIEEGEKVALVGPSGAGKSTIFQLLLRFYSNYEGRILIDEKDIQDIPLKSYRSLFSIVPQDVILFGGTIRENISYGHPDADESRIREAAEKANAVEFIDRFPDKMDTIVGERGVKLSGGQKQRIAIARALLKDPQILLLDEATSSLDAESEKVVQDALAKLMEGRTSLIIAHRLSTIRDVNKILVLEQGKIVETGTHQSLIEKEEGVYRSLARLQLEGDTGDQLS